MAEPVIATSVGDPGRRLASCLRPRFDRGSELKFADAEDVPYVVVPRDTPGGFPSFQRDGRIGNGDLAVAIVGGRCSFGVVGDSGPWFRLGEARSGPMNNWEIPNARLRDSILAKR